MIVFMISNVYMKINDGRKIPLETAVKVISKYSKTCVKWPFSKRPKIGFKDQFIA